MSDILDKMMEAGLLDQQASNRVQALHADGKSLDEALRTGIDEEVLLRYLAQEFKVPYVDIEGCQPESQLLSRFPAKLLLDHQLLPLRENNGAIVVASSRLFDATGLDELRVACDRDIHLALAPASEIERAIKRLLGVGADTLQTLASDGAGLEIFADLPSDNVDLADAAEDASIVKFVNQVLAEGIYKRSTDVHIEPFEDQLRIRYRIDGVLVEANVPSSISRFRAAIVSRLKILSHLDIAEKRLPQDGRVRLKISDREIDVRVSVIPMLYGEAVVLRILDRSATMLGLEHLGMGARDNKIFEKVLGLPHGIVLVTGPTGSGKTTTLYAGLAQINKIDRKIVTIEDPIEYQLHGVNQIQVAQKAGLTFAKGLRAILRHDPDVILVGEIRDHETAQIAVQASLTGHLVFSTLHTNDAPGALTRMVDMGIEPYLVASSLELVMAQRLVRLICPECREELPAAEVAHLRSELGPVVPEKIYRGIGCRNCQESGFHGRQGIFEMMPVSDEIQAMALEHCSSKEIRKLAIKQGMRSLREDGWRLIQEGRTTIEEVMRVTKDEDAGLNAIAQKSGTPLEPPKPRSPKRRQSKPRAVKPRALKPTVSKPTVSKPALDGNGGARPSHTSTGPTQKKQA